MRKSVKDAFVLLRGEFMLRVLNRSPRVLFWHGVDDINNIIVEAETCAKDIFIKQIMYLREYYDIISIDEFYKRYTLGSFTNKEIVLTFDDGYKNNLTVVAPLLKSLSIPFTVFVSVNNVASVSLFPTSIVRLLVFGSQLNKLEIPLIGINHEMKTLEQKKIIANRLFQEIKSSSNQQVLQIQRELLSNVSTTNLQKLLSKYPSILPMNWDEVKKLRDYECTIGSHCLDHFCCHENQDKSEIIRQISASKQIIENELGTPCSYFAYPNGDYSDFSNKCVKDSGYKLGFSTRRDRILAQGNDSTSIPRLHVPHELNTSKIFINLHPIKSVKSKHKKI